jgi:chromosome segregation ATPase
MTDSKSSLDDLVSKLKQERDELRLQMHLAGMEAKEEYERISGKVDDLSDQYDPVKDAVEESASNLLTALGMVADELKHGFNRVRKSISEDK